MDVKRLPNRFNMHNYSSNSTCVNKSVCNERSLYLMNQICVMPQFFAADTTARKKTIQSMIDMVKLLRVYGGCLGVERRRRTWQTAISPGQESSIR